MKNIRRIAISLVLAIALLLSVVSITNTQSTRGTGTVVGGAIVYFSVTAAQDDDYSQIDAEAKAELIEQAEQEAEEVLSELERSLRNPN